MSGRAILMPMRLTDLVGAPPSRATNFKVALAALVLVATAFSSAALVHFATPRSGSQTMLWREISWPFPRDGWPAGRAFRCGDAGCRGVELYVRPKAGFCNCDTGVADDDEVDRVADLDLISPRFAPLKSGAPVRVAGLAGRIRAYDMPMPDGARHTAIGIALSRRCDLFVAVAHGKDLPANVEHTALKFLASEGMTRWVISVMDGQ